MTMTYSKTGTALTEQFESCRLVAYQDIRGIWTCGWGHTGPEVVEGLVLLLNQGAFQASAEQFARWDHASGKVVAGLLRRREAETAEFKS